MATERPRQRFHDILDHIRDIHSFSEGVKYEDFSENREKSFAIQLALLRISEAARKLGDIAERWAPDIPWRDVRDLGNVIRHDYDNVDTEKIWNIVHDDLPRLQDACERALEHPDLQGRD